MNQEFKNELAVVALGCLMHDIGKVIQRADTRPDEKPKTNHSSFGYNFLKKFLNDETIHNKELLNFWNIVSQSIKLHMKNHLKIEKPTSPFPWFCYEADNIASSQDRKINEQQHEISEMLSDSEGYRIDECDVDPVKAKWDPRRKLNPIFSNFQGLNNSKKFEFPLWYRCTKINEFNKDVFIYNSYPYPEEHQSSSSTQNQYQNIVLELEKLFEYIQNNYRELSSINTTSINIILSYFEDLFSMVPPDTFTGNTNDVSLYDHLKLTAAIGSCMYLYDIKNADGFINTFDVNNQDQCFGKINKLRSQNVFLLVKADISGIQDFIYNISSKAALKGLRGRSFYLELLQTHLIDQFLENLSLTKANLLYQGGGGFALLLPNTQEIIEQINEFRDKINKWLFSKFDIRLHLAVAYEEINGNELKGTIGYKNKTNQNPLSQAWKQLHNNIAEQKQHKFGFMLEDVFKINQAHNNECHICHQQFNTDDLINELLDDLSGKISSICHLCKKLIDIGKKLPDCSYEVGLELHFNKTSDKKNIVLPDINGLNQNNYFGYDIEIKKGNENSYVLHNYHPYKPPKLFWSLSTQLDNNFGDLAKHATGVQRIGVFRADVDNLGKIFSGQSPNIGLPNELRSISRDSTLSRSLAKYFTQYLDDFILQNDDKYKIITVYAGVLIECLV